MPRSLLVPLLGCALIVATAAPSRAELRPWDQTQVSALAKQLEEKAVPLEAVTN